MNNLKITDLIYKYKNLKKIGLYSKNIDIYLNSKNLKDISPFIKKQNSKKVDCFLFINSRTKNTHVTFSLANGNVLYSSSLGNLGYKKASRSSSFPTNDLFFSLNKLIKENNLNHLGVKVKGFGRNRRFLVRKLSFLKISIAYIQDIGFLPHNGCRAKKLPRK
jgi:small subunit ribosomal protein S11